MLKTVLPYVVPLLVIGLLIWRSSRSMKGRRVNAGRLWIRPGLIAVLMLAMFASSPKPPAYAFGLFAAAALAGVAMGYLLSRHQQLSIDPTTQAVMSKTSPIGVLLFVGLYAARYLLKLAVIGGQAPSPVMAHSTQFIVYTDAGLFFVLGLVAAQAWETSRRIKLLTAGAVADQPAE